MMGKTVLTLISMEQGPQSRFESGGLVLVYMYVRVV